MMKAIILLKREYWENRGLFAITPFALGGSFIALVILALFNTEHLFKTHASKMEGIDIDVTFTGFSFLGSMTVEFASLPLARRQEIWEIAFYGISNSFTFFLLMVSFIYLLGSLYDDRKDRSILFWKSLPVSDLMTVNSKIITVLFIIPAFFVVATALTFITMLLIFSLVALFSGGSLWLSIWQPAPFLMVPAKLYMTYVIQSLWAAPFLAWLLLASSFATRKPVLLATFPIIIIVFLEFYFYRTAVFLGAVKDRAFGWFISVDTSNGLQKGTEIGVLEPGVINNNAYSLMGLADFWYGLIVAGVMVAAAVYIRRYRDES